VYWTAVGWGYLISVLFPASQSQIAGVLSVLFNMMFSGSNPTLPQFRNLLGGVLIVPTYVSYLRWANEAFYVAEVEHYTNLYEHVDTSLVVFGYEMNSVGRNLGIIYGMGCAVRLIAYLILEFKDRDKKQ
jgi:hypothetical protein